MVLPHPKAKILFLIVHPVPGKEENGRHFEEITEALGVLKKGGEGARKRRKEGGREGRDREGEGVSSGGKDRALRREGGRQQL